MNTQSIETARSPQPVVLSRPQIRRARFADYEQIVRLEAIFKSDAPSPDEWRMLWQGSPLWPQLGKSWPIGWVLETAAGEIVGSLGNIPVGYHFRGERLIGVTGRGWVVAPEYRGRYPLRLLGERFSQPDVDLFVDTTVGPMARGCGDRFSSRVPVGDWETIAYCIIGYRAFATRALRKLNVPLAETFGPLAGQALRLKDAAFAKKSPKTRSSFAIEAVDRFDSRFDAFWDERVRQSPDTLLACRDSATLSWHFARAMRHERLWIITAARNGRLCAYCIFIRQGHADELPRMRLVDYQTIDPDVELLPDLLRTALLRCAEENVCVLDKPGVGIAKMRAFDEFAPYRRKQSWPLFYRANGSELADALREPKVWDPSEYDGDASLE